MSTVLVFGASGAVGRFALPLLAPVHRLLPVSRSARPDWITADLNDSTATLPDAEIALSLGPLDAFAVWLERRPVGGLRRIVAMSSMSAQTKRDSPDPAERALAQRLRDAESRLREAATARNIPWTIFRPTLIYGAGIDKTLAPLARLAQRWRVLPIPFGASGSAPAGARGGSRGRLPRRHFPTRDIRQGIRNRRRRAPALRRDDPARARSDSGIRASAADSDKRAAPAGATRADCARRPGASARRPGRGQYRCHPRFRLLATSISRRRNIAVMTPSIDVYADAGAAPFSAALQQRKS